MQENASCRTAVPIGGKDITVLVANAGREDFAKRGRLLSFGRHVSNDIKLPLEKVSETKHKYNNDHCFFYLASSGELILRAGTVEDTVLEVGYPSPIGKLYMLDGSPPQRVIPRTTAGIVINIGVPSARFRLYWPDEMLAPGQFASTQDLFAGEAIRLHIEGMTATAQEMVPSAPRYETRSTFTPSVPEKYAAHKPCHVYSKIGEGVNSVVDRVVDLRNGDVWARKRLKEGGNPTYFKNEVDCIGTFRHENIVHFECFEDFKMGGEFRIFMRLYRGSLADLIRPRAHKTKANCLAPMVGSWKWGGRLVVDLFGVLDFLGGKGLIHHDIRPDNILVEWAHDGDQLREKFVLADFGLARRVAGKGASTASHSGITFYCAPEIVTAKKAYIASDVFAAGILFAKVQGSICEKEVDFTTTEWTTKLAELGDQSGKYVDPLPPTDGKDMATFRWNRWAHRLSHMVREGLLGHNLSTLLETDPSKRPPAVQLVQ
ncbi:kinase-like domain-containing protein, partial [Lasiosphaeria ovina]